MKRIYLIIISLFGLLPTMLSQVVQREIAPEIDYSRTPRQYYIGDISIDGVSNYDDYLLIGLSGLSKGQKIENSGHASLRLTTPALGKTSATT